jgi:hypothetical protein
MTAAEARQGSRIGLIVGVAAFAGGLWLLLNAMNVAVPEFRRLWPILFIIAAVAAFVDYFFIKRVPSSAGWMVTFFGFGILGFAVTLGYTDVGKILDWLPSFPTIIGLGILTTYVAGGRDNDSLPVAGGVLVILGVLGFAARFNFLQKLLPSAQIVWALIFLIGGAWLVWRYVLRSKGD